MNRTPDITAQVEAFMQPLPMVPAQPTRAIIEAVDYIVQEGPAAHRPVWAVISLLPDYRTEYELFGHRLHEVRPLGTTVRILAIYGPDRTLVLLYAGDKQGDWNRWYRVAIPEGAQLDREYLEDTGQAET